MSPNELINRKTKIQTIMFADFFEIFKKEHQKQILHNIITKNDYHIEFLLINWQKMNLNFSLNEKVKELEQQFEIRI